MELMNVDDDYIKYIDNYMTRFNLLNYDKMKYGETIILESIPYKYLEYALSKFIQEIPINNTKHYCFASLDIRASYIFFDKNLIYFYKIDAKKIHSELLSQYNANTYKDQYLKLKIPRNEYNYNTYLLLAQDLFINHNVSMQERLTFFNANIFFLLSHKNPAF